MPVRVQAADFDVGAELMALRLGNANTAGQVGAVACFVGTVRDLNEGLGVNTMTLEHYPGMTEKALEGILTEANARWDLIDCLVIHRFGELSALDQIVMVGVTSAHRGEAFSACEFIMDFLKTQAPFWKKESNAAGQRWVQARDKDDLAAARWDQSKPAN
jgi:molybdopterin synthase catalytic subunit